MNNIFTIRNLKCKYPKAAFHVLDIELLDITKGAITFFIGASGVGKSTILETLGLMSNTIYPDNNCVFDYTTTGMLEFWNWGEARQSEVRKKNFSFIFQNTNLLPNLTAYENICLTGVIRGNTHAEAQQKANGVITATFDAKEAQKIYNGDSIFNFSGGQRQRVAFARALCSEYSVLFADEPTGNLDWCNANKLMATLANNIDEEKTVIIVSHDISLALKYGNEIVLIEKKDSVEPKFSYGYINNYSKYKKTNANTWHNELSGEIDTESFRILIESVLCNQNL